MPKHPKGNYDDGSGTYVIPLLMDEEMPCIIFKKKRCHVQLDKVCSGQRLIDTTVTIKPCKSTCRNQRSRKK